MPALLILLHGDTIWKKNCFTFQSGLYCELLLLHTVRHKCDSFWAGAKFWLNPKGSWERGKHEASLWLWSTRCTHCTCWSKSHICYVRIQSAALWPGCSNVGYWFFTSIRLSQWISFKFHSCLCIILYEGDGEVGKVLRQCFHHKTLEDVCQTRSQSDSLHRLKNHVHVLRFRF